jgi:murein DD-endopeptidase MepM/ murein hydrolase activator NlpD
MARSRTALTIILAAAILVCAGGDADAKRKRDRVARDFRHTDADGNGELSREEWNRRGNFKRLDADGNGALSLDEVRAMYEGVDEREYSWPPTGIQKPTVEIDPSIEADRIDAVALDEETLCGIGRMIRCDTEPQIKRGLAETGTGPQFPDGAACPGIDDYWAMDYAYKRNRQSFHGGIDLPVPWGTPMRAVAAGSVVAIYKAEQSKRGIELVLRHTPDQTGLPFWTYSAYGHMDRDPEFEIGERVKMGQIIGPTGNTGISARGRKGGGQSSTRRPAIHLAMFRSDKPIYGEANDTIIPANGHWLDPIAFYRQSGPYDSPSLIALPDSEKAVPVPVMLTDGTTLPADTKRIWPYACKR